MPKPRSLWENLTQWVSDFWRKPGADPSHGPRRLHFDPLEERRLLSVSLTGLPHQIVNNQDAAYSETGGDWESWNASDLYGGICRYHAAGDGAATAQWTFGSLDPTQSYQIYATWNASGNHGSNVPYTVYDGTTALATVQLNQQFAPDQATLDGQDFESLGAYRTDGSLSVQMSDAANGYVVANAIVLVEVPPVTTAPSVVDNADAAYAETGSDWLGWSSSDSYQGDCRYAPAGNGSNTATWTFQDVDPTQEYQVYATWNAAGNHASNAPYTVYDDTTAGHGAAQSAVRALGRHDRRLDLAERGHVPGRKRHARRLALGRRQRLRCGRRGADCGSPRRHRDPQRG